MKVQVIPFLYENLNSLYDHYSLSDTLFCTSGGRIDGLYFVADALFTCLAYQPWNGVFLSTNQLQPAYQSQKPSAEQL